MLRYMAAGVASLALALASLAPAHGQQSVFKSRVDLVTVDVTVLDGSGAPLEGLGADRFEVTVDGARRRVVWAEYIAHRATLLRAAEPSAHFSSNERVDPGRLVMIAVDQAHVRRVEGLAALRAAVGFVDALDPADRVAGAPLNHAGAIEFTSDHGSVRRYLQRLTGSAGAMPVHFNIGLSEAMAISDGSRTRLDQVVLRECGEPLGRFENLRRLAESDGMRDPCPVQVEQEGRALAQQARTEARLSVDALGRLIVRLAEIDGPKTLVLISEGLVAEPQLFDLTALGAAAQAARVTIYVLQLEVPTFEAAETAVSATVQADRQVRADGLARLAGSARGALFRLVGADPYPFRRILKELSGYYLVAFEAAEADRDGRTHRIDVRTRTPGVTIRARPAFRIPAGSAAPTENDLVRLLRSARLATEVPLRAAAYAFREPQGERLRVIVSAETDAAGAAREMTIGYLLVDARSVIIASGSGRTEAGRYSVPAVIPPGRYRLKAAAIDDAGRQGSVERRFNAQLTSLDPLRFSDFMLAEPASDPAAPLRPAVIRAAGDRLVAYLEAYAPLAWRPADSAAAFEVADDRGGPARISVPAQITGAGAGRWTITAEVPLRDLPPGAYTAVARVTLAGAPAQRLTRPFVIVPRVP